MIYRTAWKAHVSDVAEYRRRHDEIWPEMTEMLNAGHIHNYTIWNIGDELFAYMECDVTPEESNQLLAAYKEVNERWQKHMEGLLVHKEGDGDLTQVFYHP